MGLMHEFRDFLKEYKVMGLAVAFIIGAAATTLIQSLVNNILMPLITPFIPDGAYESWKAHLGPVTLGVGAFIGAVINFVIIAFAVFVIAKYVMKEEKVTKK